MKDPTQARFQEFLEEDEEDTSSIRWYNQLCPECDGEGTTWHGIVLTSSDFDEDPEGMYEAIDNGYFDRACPLCDGAKVVQFIDEESLSSDLRATLHDHMQSVQESYAMSEMERRMGC